MARFPKMALALLILGALIAGLLLSDRGRTPPSPTPSPPPRATPRPSARPIALAPSVTPAPKPSAGPDLSSAIDGFLGKVPVRVAPAPDQLLGAASAEGAGPIDYKNALRETLRKRKGAAREAARMLLESMDETDERLVFQHALALSHHLNAAATDQLLAGLDKASPRARRFAVFALRGSPEARVHRRLGDVYAQDEAPAVRAQAGTVLAERYKQVEPLVLERARNVARADWTSEAKELVDSAADVLAVPPLSANDRRLLETTLTRDPSTHRRRAAFRALATAQVPPHELRPLLEQVAKDPNADEELRRQARQALSAPEAKGP